MTDSSTSGTSYSAMIEMVDSLGTYKKAMYKDVEVKDGGLLVFRYFSTENVAYVRNAFGRTNPHGDEFKSYFETNLNATCGNQSPRTGW